MPVRERVCRALIRLLGRPLLYALHAALPQGQTFWDGVAWAARLFLIYVHLAFALPTFLRPNIPLLLPSFSAFDDVAPFTVWGWGGLLAAALLWLLPPRLPWGVLSTGFSTFYLYLIGATFGQGAGLISGVLNYVGFGVLSGALLMRALWAWAEPQPWFREHIIRRPPRG